EDLRAAVDALPASIGLPKSPSFTTRLLRLEAESPKPTATALPNVSGNRGLHEVGETGFEPATPWSRTKCSTRLSHSPRPTPLTSREAFRNRWAPQGSTAGGSRPTACRPTPTSKVTHGP